MNADREHQIPAPNTRLGSDDDRVVTALEEYSNLIRAGRRPDQRQFVARFPDIADELQVCLEGLELVEGIGAELTSVPGDVETSLQGTLGDYRIVKEVGRGGMGVVYEAEQISLCRRVALKVLPFAATVDPRQLQRFRNESRAAASLRHDHIVHVYGVGCDRGIHYYAMEFIDGQPLTAVLASMRQQLVGAINGLIDTAVKQVTAPLTSHRPGSADQFRAIAELLVQAAEAVDYAHGMGIIHRDIKPSNLLLDHHGKIWITDFGLAKLGADATGTMTGDIIGTLRYMSPEQALAKHGLVDHRTDIYALGATLYELLTLQPAVSGTDKQEVLQRIAFAEPVRPSTVQPKIPRELDTIVMKALEKQPEARYASAKELAEDLRRWLEDKPIRAKRPGLWERMGKWVRRHSGVATTLAVAAMVLLAVIAVGLAVNNRMVHREQSQTHAALAAESQARRHAMAALHSLTDHFIAHQLAQQESLDDEDRAFLMSVLRRYEEFAAVGGDVRESRTIRAEGNCRVGILRNALGDFPEARACFQQAHLLYRQLSEQFPDVTDYRAELAGVACQLGQLLTALVEYDLAGIYLREAIALQQQLVEQFPDNVDYRRALADSFNNSGLLHFGQSRPAEAIADYRRAITLRHHIVEAVPANHRYQTALAQSYNNLGNALKSLGQKSTAESEYRQSIALMVRQIESGVSNPFARQLLATSQSNLALLLAELGRVKPAEAEYRKALQQKKQLAADFPTIPAHQRELAMAHANFGVFLLNVNQIQEAENEYRQALAIRRKLATDFPTAPNFQLDLLIGHNQLGTLLSQRRRIPEAEKEFQAALALGDRWMADGSAIPNQALNLASVDYNYSQFLMRAGRYSEAESQIQRAITIMGPLVKDYPDVPDYRFRQAMNHNCRGRIAAKLGNSADASTDYRLSLQLMRELTTAFPSNDAYAIESGSSFCNFGLLQSSGHEKEEALALFAQAIAVLTPITEREPQLAPARLNLRNSHGGRAKTLEQLNRHAEAVADWDRVIELDQGPQRDTFRVQRALCLARCQPAAAVTAAEELIAVEKPPPMLLFEAARVMALIIPQEKDESARKKWSDRAVSLLQAARDRGYFKSAANLEALRHQADFQAIRARDDIQRLLRETHISEKPR